MRGLPVSLESGIAVLMRNFVYEIFLEIQFVDIESQTQSQIYYTPKPLYTTEC
jgi:hypothetical protein